MSYKRNWDIINVSGQIRSMVREMNDPGLTGYVNWGVKQDLYRLKWMLEESLKEAPHFGSIEDEWIREEEKKKVIKILKSEE